MSEAAVQRTLGRVGPIQIAIIALVIITALVHFQQSARMFAGPPAGFARPNQAQNSGQSNAPANSAGTNGQAQAPNGNASGQNPAGRRGAGNLGFAIMRRIPIPLPFLFLLNGIGYLTLLVGLYLPALQRWQPIIRWVLIGFITITIIMYFLIVGLAPNPIGIADKIAEVGLIVLLLIEARQATQRPIAIPQPA